MRLLKWWVIDQALGLLGAVLLFSLMPVFLLIQAIFDASDTANVELLRARAAAKTNQERKRTQR